MRRPLATSLAPHAVLLVVQLAFASLAVEGKLAMGPGVGVPPAALAMARIGCGAVFFAVLARSTAKAEGAPVTLRDLGPLAGLSLLGIVLNQTLFLAGLRTSSPFGATTLGSTIPLFTAVASIALGRERLSARVAAGMVMGTLGVLVMGRFSAPRAGDLFVLANAASYGVYLALAQPTVKRLGAWRASAWLFGMGALWLAPIGGAALVAAAPGFDARAWRLVAFIVLVPTIGAYGGNAWALARVAPGQVAGYVYLQPVLVALLARVQLGQPIEARTVVAAALILGGVTFVVRR